ncbi:diguanylate phosphodiesterase [Streptomyces sp. WAC 01529]|uniref:helix-turn-helix domain-containing protein n=1 Tax=Streptomyces sp. WAC 01529 TaxID=2203205 RepID=UPI000F70176A|nr:GAF domain-containing protein [Streptomyces sp. WAC 01529]AZM51531.1 diguanylate phosphodiesterase [Streptomyces sp. WAC 01529]
MTTVNDRTYRAAAHSAMVALRQLLTLLASGASPEQFTRPSGDASTAQLPPEERALVEDATRIALEIRRTLDQHRRREAELAALFDTASDLAALRDLDAVLRAIVHRARTLVGTDAAYLTLNDPVAKDTYMRVTDGSVSARFQQLRLGMGEGLGGLVAQTARPYTSADYQTDPRFKHTRAIDEAVLEEGLRGILGVPLRVGKRVIGVLFAADRTTRDFPPEAIALLTSLADHAAVAIDSARMLEETRSALVELNTANETARAHSTALRRAADAHDRLTDLVLRGATVDDLVREIAALLGGGIALHDPDGTEMARAGTAPLTPSPQGITASRTGGRAVPVDGTWVCAVLAGSELLGSIVLTSRADLADPDRRLFERAALVAALLLLLRRTVAEAEDRVRGELLDDLLTSHKTGGRHDGGSMTLRARKLGINLSRPHAVLTLDTDNEPRSHLFAEAVRHARSLGGLAGIHDGHIVLLVPSSDPGALAAELARDLGKAAGTPVTVGSAGPATGPEQLPGTYTEAGRCLHALHALGRTGDGSDIAGLGFLGVLLGDRSDLDGFVQRYLGPVLAYDQQRGTELVQTLDAYYTHGASLSKAKDALHVHVNTVVQRLDRVAQLLGADWNSPTRALELQLALKLHRLGSH